MNVGDGTLTGHADYTFDSGNNSVYAIYETTNVSSATGNLPALSMITQQIVFMVSLRQKAALGIGILASAICIMCRAILIYLYILRFKHEIDDVSQFQFWAVAIMVVSPLFGILSVIAICDKFTRGIYIVIGFQCVLEILVWALLLKLVWI